MNICRTIDEVVARRSDEPAFVARGRNEKEISLTFAEFDARTRRIGAGLARRGVGRGDRVVILVPMQIELYLCLVAVMRIGAVAVFVDPHMQRRHFDHCCGLVEPRAFIGIPKAHLLRLTCPQLRRVPVQLSVGYLPRVFAERIDLLCATPFVDSGSAVVDVETEQAALIGFTTGSSGAPRGSTRTHGFLAAQIDALYRPQQKRDATVDLPGFPVLPLDNLVRGRTTILPRFRPGKIADIDSARLLQQIERYSPDMMSGAPAYLEAIARVAIEHSRTLDCVKMLFTGGAPMSRRALQRLVTVWRYARIMVVYGSTEAEPVARIDAPEIIDHCFAKSMLGHGYCVGYPLTEIDLAIVPLDVARIDNVKAVELPCFGVGEIVVRGAHVNTGYWNDSEGEKRNKIKADDGVWHRMGDAGYRDKRGRLWLLGRCHTAIPAPWSALCRELSGDFDPRQSVWIFPYQVEAIVNEFDGVKRSAYVHVDDSYLLLLDIAKGHADPEALITGIRIAVRDFPVSAVRIQKLPVDPRHNSKIDYRAVIESLKGEIR